MLDKNAMFVLKTLNKLADTDYKVVTVDEILAASSTKNSLDAEQVKHIVEFLFKQEYINIKFSEDSTYCYCVLAKAKQLLEQTSTKKASAKTKNNINQYLFTALASFVGTLLALILFCLIK